MNSNRTSHFAVSAFLGFFELKRRFLVFLMGHTRCEVWVAVTVRRSGDGLLSSFTGRNAVFCCLGNRVSAHFEATHVTGRFQSSRDGYCVRLEASEEVGEAKGVALMDEEVRVMDDTQNEKLDSILAQGKDELDKAVTSAKEIGKDEALALGYVELIEIILIARGVNFRVDPESYYNVYDAYRTKGEGIPDPASKLFLGKLARLDQPAMYFRGKRDHFLQSWCIGFAEVISTAARKLVEGSIIPPQEYR
jgi:hypothetical protein